MNFLPACPAEWINLNYPTKDHHWPKFIRKLRDCHTKLKVWCHIKVSSRHCYVSLQPGLHCKAALSDWNEWQPRRESTLQHCRQSAVLLSLLWGPITLQSHIWSLTRAAECHEGERQHPQSQPSWTTGCIHRHGALDSWNGSLRTTEH